LILHAITFHPPSPSLLSLPLSSLVFFSFPLSYPITYSFICLSSRPLSLIFSRSPFSLISLTFLSLVSPSLSAFFSRLSPLFLSRLSLLFSLLHTHTHTLSLSHSLSLSSEPTDSSGDLCL